ncbi:MAG: peptidyl-prolyl cis-trans isomerase [Puniceicoccales bacterium]|jgi:hypothetical protein|nr:peptidyl-prolyl cis-trans isomerase [Puniceicoccales bacterium]
MLSGIQLFLEKNRRWLFALLLIVIVIPFVFTIGSMPGLGYGKKRVGTQFWGYDLGDPKQMERVVRDGALSIALQTGSEENAWMEAAQGYAFYRLFLLHVARVVGLPDPIEDELHQFIKTKPLFLDENKEFQPQLYNDYLKKWFEQFGKTQNLRRLLTEDYLCERVKKVLAEPGFVLPRECEVMYKYWTASYQLQYVSLRNEAVPPENVSEKALQEFFELHKNDYRIERKAEVVLLFFEANKHRASLPLVSDQELERYFALHKHEFKKVDSEEVSFEVVKSAVKDRWEKEQLNALAEKCATQFALTVYDKGIQMQTVEWKQWLNDNDVRTIDTLPPYGQNSLPERKGLGKDVLLKAFDLDQERFLSDPMPVKNGYVLVALKQFLDPYYPILDTVKEKILQDYQRNERDKIFNQQLSSLAEDLNKPNTNVEKLLADRGLEIHNVDTFTLDSSIVSLSQILEADEIFRLIKMLETLKQEQWTSALRGKDGTRILFVCKSRSVKEDCIQEEAFKVFEKNFGSRKSLMHTETLLREVLEKTMNALDQGKQG